MIKKNKKKFLIAVAITLAIISLIYLIIYFFVPGLFYRILYFDDRVKITTNIYVDEEKVEVDKDSIKISGDGVGRKHISNNEKILKLSFKGREYSRYRIYLKAKDYNFAIVISHFNWWDIFKIDLRIDINTKQNTITYYSTNKFISESKGYKEDIIETNETKELQELNEVWIN